MQKRKTRKKAHTKRRKTTRKTAAAPRKSRKAIASNKQSHWVAYQNLEEKIGKAFTTLRSNIRKKASPKTINSNKNELLLLLGECNYMARECMRCEKKTKRQRA